MSKLYYATEIRFIKKNGKYYSLGGGTNILWQRFLKHFDCVIVIARVLEDSSADVNETMLSSLEGVSFIELPYYIGLKSFLLQRQNIKKKLKKSILLDGVYLCRLPGQIGSLVIEVLRAIGGKYACEIVGNPWDVFAKGSVNHPLRSIIRIVSTQQLKSQLKGASAALYVTQFTLQNMYPVNDNVYSVGVSDVILKDSLIATSSKTLTKKNKFSLISIGSLEQMYKAPDIVLKALKQLQTEGQNCELVWLGDGKYKNEMLSLAYKLGIGEKVFFKGNVSPNAVISELRQSDIFLLVSRTEGLPRVMIEAMAQGLPCIGTQVGGIPELLTQEVLVEKDNYVKLARLLSKMISDIDFTNKQAQRNLEVARSYKESILEEKRTEFFKYIKSSFESCRP